MGSPAPQQATCRFRTIEPLLGGFDDDVIAGEDGDDRIQVVGLGVDRVDCGEGNDTVYAGPEDIVAANCESVRI